MSPVFLQILLVLALLVAVVALAVLATRFRVPYPVLLVLGGLLLGFIPGVKPIALDPDIVLLLFLPPLIVSAAGSTSWRDFRKGFVSISLLAVGLVLATVVLVALFSHALLGWSWSVAFTLGAIISPTDDVAGSVTIESMGVSRRIKAIIGGESLLNDATGLVAYSFAVAAVLSGTFSLWSASLQFVYVSVVGLGIGLLVAWPISWLDKYINNAPQEITITVVTPFVAYLLAQQVGASGVLAALAAGLYMGRRSALLFSSNTRLQANSFWNVLVFAFNGLIFILLGLQLHSIVTGIARYSLLTLLWYTLLISLTVILVRLVWVFAANALLRLLDSLFHRPSRYPGWRNMLVVSWTGMRGGVSLATALALPLMISKNVPFPNRELLLFFTFGVILFTLVVQGVTLGPLIRWLGLQNNPSPDLEYERRQAKLATSKAALTRLESLAQRSGVPEDFVAHLRSYFQQKEDIIMSYGSEQNNAVEKKEHQQNRASKQRVLKAVIGAEREALVSLRNQDTIDDDVMRELERELDLEEEQLGNEQLPILTSEKIYERLPVDE